MSINQMQLISPLTGLVVPMDQVPDPVFSQKSLGAGIAIDPTTNTMVAPCAGTVVHLHPAHHAMTLQTESGDQILLHLGIDTVKLKGEGFVAKVKQGDKVQTGQVLLEFNPDTLALKAKSLISVVVALEKTDITIGSAKSVLAGRDSIFSFSVKAPAVAASTNANLPFVTSKAIAITLPQGLHARPCAQVAQAAKKYQSDIELLLGSRKANAKSVVALMLLNVAKDDTISVRAKGPDAKKASSELLSFIQGMKEEPMKAPEAKKTAVPSGKPQLENVFNGSVASPGVAIGKVQQFQAEEFNIVETGQGVASEKSLLDQALLKASNELKDLLRGGKDPHSAKIFEAHTEILQDPDLLAEVNQLIQQGKSAAFAWSVTIDKQAKNLAALNNELMSQRAMDLKDVEHRLLRTLCSSSQKSAKKFPADTILIAKSISPSEAATLDRQSILGFATTTGGSTSHVAILARSLELPAIVGADKTVLEIPNGTEVILDAHSGEIIIDPTDDQRRVALTKQQMEHEKRKMALEQAMSSASTNDGHKVEVLANVNKLSDLDNAIKMGCDGVGLMRTEFLFLDRSTAPNEEEQHQIYQDVANKLGNKPLTIRTLDVGGDKPLSYLPMPHEENPFLGIRGLRLSLKSPEMFREQLRALLRVKSKSKIKIMFPMVTELSELLEAKKMLEEEKLKVKSYDVEIGMMVEVPSAALLAETFAPHIDFFSIGTNDLSQYTMAMDRGHDELGRVVDGLHPSVLKLIDMTAKAALAHNKQISVCGNSAGDAQAIEILLGLGVDKLSVSPSAIPLVKARIRETSQMKNMQIGKKSLLQSNAQEVRQIAKDNK